MEMNKRHGFFAVAVAVLLTSCASGNGTVTSASLSRATAATTTSQSSTSRSTTTKPNPTTTTTTTIQTTTTAAKPTLASGIVEIFGAKFQLDPGVWEVIGDPKHPSARTFVIRKATCQADNKLWCPGFAVVTPSGFSDLLPYSASRLEGICYQDDFHNGGYGLYGPPKKIGTTSVGGKLVDHMMQEPCGQSEDRVHSWKLPHKGNLVIFDTDLHSTEPLQELIAEGGILSSIR